MSTGKSQNSPTQIDVICQSDKLRQQARENHLSGDTQSAIILLSQAIQSDPTNALIALDMVQIFLDISEFDQANNLFNKLPESTRETSDGISIKTQLNFIQLAEKTEGMAILKLSVLKDPDDYQSRFDLAICHFAQHEISDGMALLFFIQENQPDFKMQAAREMIAMVCNLIAKTDPKKSDDYRNRLAMLLS